MKKTGHYPVVSLLQIAIALLSIGTFYLAQASENPYVWKPRVTALSVYKDGHGFFQREGPVKLHDGWGLMEAFPPAAFGTLAIYSHKESETVDTVISGSAVVVDFDDPAIGMDDDRKHDLLSTYRDLTLELRYTQYGRDQKAVGRLVSIGTEYVVLEAEDNNYAVPIAGISRLQILGAPARFHVRSETGEEPVETTLGMIYLRKGVTWIPEYTLTLLDDSTAELVLRGTLVNEAEDIIDGDVHFVIGVPYFRHNELLTPVAVGQVVRGISGMAPREVMTQVATRAGAARDVRSDPFAVVDQAVPVGVRDLREATGNLPQWEGAGANDFTVYTRGGLTVRQGERAIVRLFANEIRYGHIYRWSPPGDIEHYLVLHNETGTAWTTGPCLVSSDGKALSEDLLKYVPVGGRGELRVSTAINIAHNQREEEVDRKLKAHQPSHNVFLDLVTLDGVLTLNNFGRETADVVVDLTLAGRPLAASEGGRISQDASSLQLQERVGHVHWRVALEAGETKELTYQYERYVRSQ